MWYNIVLFAGVLLLGISLYLLRDRIRFLKSGEIATGTVIRLKGKKDSEGDLSYSPIFKFTTHDNQEIIFDYDVYSSPPDWSVGDTSRIAYDMHDPKNATLLTYFASFGLIVILTAISMVLLVIGGGYYLAESFFKTL